MPRLFTGLEVPAHIRAILGMKQAGLAKLRWIDPSDFHLTLRFIGNVHSQQANEIVDALSRKQWVAPTITLDEVKCFGGGKPTTLFASVKADAHLSALASAHDRLMQQMGLPPDPRRFTPHVTLARCKGISAQSVARYLSLHGAAMPGLSYRPERFVLYSARESKGGGPYRIEETWPLLLAQPEARNLTAIH